MIDIEHCTILGDETVDANSLNRCMFNLYRKMTEAGGDSVDATSENVPESPFFSGGYHDMLEYLNENVPPFTEEHVLSATDDRKGVVPRLYRGNLDIFGSQDDPSFATESETGAYYYSAEQLSTFAPTVDALYGSTAPLLLRPVAFDDESTMVTGVSSLGTASSPIVRFTSYLTCSRSGVSFGTVTFDRKNGDRQKAAVTLNISRDLVGIDGIESVDFFSIGNGFASGVRTVSENLDMVSDITQCTVTYNSDNEVIVTDITKSDDSDTIRFDADTGRIVSGDVGDYVEIPNDKVVLDFFVLFTLKESVLKYSDDLWCFYIVNNLGNPPPSLRDARSWAKDYFRYTFEGFECADVGHEDVDGTHQWLPDGWVTDATDAFNGCYNATFSKLQHISPSLRYAERMFKGCTHATFDMLPAELSFNNMRSAASMFENCMASTFGDLRLVEMPNASRMGMMFAGCTNASFDLLEEISLGGDASKMFYGDSNADFLSLRSIEGNATRLISMFEGCPNASFPALETIYSGAFDSNIDATRMFYGLEVPTFEGIATIALPSEPAEGVGYNGTSMFEGCLGATFASLADLGPVRDGTRMFAGCDPFPPSSVDNSRPAYFSSLDSVGDRLVVGSEMFRDNCFLTMHVTEPAVSLRDGYAMFMNTCSVVFDGSLGALEDGDFMFSQTMTSEVNVDMNSLKRGYEMFSNSHVAAVRGDMDALADASRMFLSSDFVDVKSFPGSVQDAQLSFAGITGHCNVWEWNGASDERYCSQTFLGSRNVSVTGDVVAGKVVSTSHMFDSAENVLLWNPGMEGDVSRDEDRFYSTTAGEKFVYAQGYEGGDLDGVFTFAGDATADSMSGEMPETLFIAANLRTKDVVYSVYSMSTSSDGTETVTMSCDEMKFEPPFAADGDYSYAVLSGYDTATLSTTSDASVRYTSTELDSESLSAGYYLRRYSDSADDGRFVSLTSYVGGAYESYPEYHFSEYASPSNISSPIMSVSMVFGSGHNVTIHIEGMEAVTYTLEDTSRVSFDFVQVSSADNIIKPQFAVTIGNGANRNSFALIPPGGEGSGTQNPYVMPLHGGYDKFIIENSADKIHVEVIEAREFAPEGEVGELAGYLMKYVNAPATDNRISFKRLMGGTSASTTLWEMLDDPKHDKNDFTVSQAFNKYDFANDVPLESSLPPARVRTRFSAGNADMSGTWKYADGMFLDVVEDSLLSGYYCLTDRSLQNVSYMFALSEPYAGEDRTFAHAGPLMQNLHLSNVTDMTGMFANRQVCEPEIFRDLFYGGEGNYLTFQVPQFAVDAASAFTNCHISEYFEEPSLSFGEIGLYVPPTLTGAAGMFDGYVGPAIRLGYGNDPASGVYFADDIDTYRMFHGCHFADDGDEQFKLSVPSIYLDIFGGSDFRMSSVSTIEVRNGLNFASPYDSLEGPFFYNDTNLLGCSEVTFESLRSDVLDWFSSDIGDVEGVYLATVVGPRNEYSEDGSLSADFRLLTGLHRYDGNGGTPAGYWTVEMSPTSQFSDEMVERLYGATNSVRLDNVAALENGRGRMACMFSLPSLFENSTEGGTLGDVISSITPHGLYADTYAEMSDDRFISKSYVDIGFASLTGVNAVEMPFAFAGLSDASFGSLRTLAPSAVMAYGAFMNCSSASFDSLETVTFVQNGTSQPNTMESRFSPTGNDEWFGNYCNMFAGCANASMSSLSSLMLNSRYSFYGEAGDRVLTWFDQDGDVNYMSFSNFTSKFAFSFYASASGGNIHVSLTNKGLGRFFDYDTLTNSSEVSSVDVRFYEPLLEGAEVLTEVFINRVGGSEPLSCFLDTVGNFSNDPDAMFIRNYTVPLTGSEERPVWRTYTIGDGGDYDIGETPKYLVLYRNATGYHSIDVNSGYMLDINYRVHLDDGGGTYAIDVYDNNDVDENPRIFTYDTGVEVDPSCTFLFEMAEVNHEMTPIITITDRHGDEHICEILADGEVESLWQHPSRATVKPLQESAETYPFMEGGSYTHLSYSDGYGQEYELQASSGDGDYFLVLSNGDVEVARLGARVSGSVSPEDVYFRIGSYASNGLNCVIVAISHGSESVFYKVYQDAYFDDYRKALKYVEETLYDPTQPLEYRRLFSTDFGPSIIMAHRAYCSGMFMDCSAATFESLDTVNIPASGSCAGMFASCESANLSGLKWLVLPTATRPDNGAIPGYRDYRGLFDGVCITSVDLGGLTESHTNIYALGMGGVRTKGYELFCGMLSEDGSYRYDEALHSMTKEEAVEKMKLSRGIADRMDWDSGTFVFNVKPMAGGILGASAEAPLRAGHNVAPLGFKAVPLPGATEGFIDWGDGTVQSLSEFMPNGEADVGHFVEISHRYGNMERRRVRVTDSLARVVFTELDADTLNSITPEELQSLVTRQGGPSIVLRNKTLVGVETFGASMNDLSFAFALCINLASTAEWKHLDVEDVSYCYYGCTALASRMPEWSPETRDCTGCFCDCVGMNMTFSDDVYELMPTHMNGFRDCVSGAGGVLRDKFFPDWGGTGWALDSNRIRFHL